MNFASDLLGTDTYIRTSFYCLYGGYDHGHGTGGALFKLSFVAGILVSGNSQLTCMHCYLLGLDTHLTRYYCM